MRSKILFFSFVFISSTILNKTIAQDKTDRSVLNRMSVNFAAKEKDELAKAVQLAKEKGWFLRKVTPKGEVIELAGLDVFGNPKYRITHNNTIAAATTRANQLWPGGSSGLNLSGSSDAMKGRLAIWDGGQPLTTHVEFNNRILVKDASSVNDHATHTSGTLIAAGVNPIAKGMAYGAQQLISYDFTNDQSEMSAEAANLVISNHSYGYSAGWVYDGTNWSWYGDSTVSKNEAYGFGYYDVSAQAFDSIAYNAPKYLIVASAGNPRGSTGPAVGSSYYYNGSTSKKLNRTAGMLNNPDYGSVAFTQAGKNLLDVGAVNGLTNGHSTPSDVVIASFSAWGPTDDGRIKPDVVADGVNVTSSSSASTTSYESLSGTSMASPNAAGSLFLLQEYYNRLHPNTFLRSASLKGLAIHTADEAGANPGPDFSFGYGLLNVLKASNVITSSYKHLTDTIIESSLTSGAPITYTFVASGTGKLSATLTWTDPAATPFTSTTNVLNNTTPRLVNDLDLRITSSSVTYKPWVLDPLNPSAAATTGDDALNNVEKIEIDSTIPGKTYTVTVSNKGTLSRGPQAFSLVVSGIGGTAYCTSVPTSNAGARIDSIAFAGINNKNSAGCTTYTSYTNLTGQIQPNQTVPLTVSLNSCDASTTNKIVKVFIDYNNNGSFGDAGELVATSGVISGSGSFTANIVTPANLTIGNFTIMRVVAQEAIAATDVNACGSYAKGETQDYRLKVASPSNDLSIINFASPSSADCANGNQYVTVTIKNNGTVDKTNVPVSVVIKNGSTTVATLIGTYPGTIAAGSILDYTFQTPFVTTAAATYTFTGIVSAASDQQRVNDTLSTSVVVAAKPAAPIATGEICGTSAFLAVTNPNAASNYFWYTDPVIALPVTSGATANIASIPANQTFYVGTGAKATVGLVTKNVYAGGGGYQANGGNYVNFSASVPVTLQTARLYTKYPGKITFTVADIGTVNTDGSYTYYPISSKTIDAYSTSPTPLAGAQTGNDPLDTGAVFLINLPLPVGDHIIITTTDANATIFRNNNVTGNPYPFTVPGVISITSNSAATTANPTNYQSFYYYLYDMRVNTLDCISDRSAVVATTPPSPTITQVGDSLVSSASLGNQWYVNGVVIYNANGTKYKPTQSGTYTVSVTDALGCTKTSNSINYVITAVTNVNPAEISLTISPNPNFGQFLLQFQVNEKTNLDVSLINAVGQKIADYTYPNFVGRFSKQINVGRVSAGVYTLKIQQNSKVYIRKIVIE